MMRAIHAVALTFTFLAITAAERVIQEHNLFTTECSEDTCDTFSQEHTSCPCGQFTQYDNGLFLSLRARRTLVNMAQDLRYLTDYETSKTFFQSLCLPTKFKNARVLQASLQDFRFVQSAVGALSAFRKFVNRPVKDLLTREVPAGAWPVMVEIWDKTFAFKKNEFIGEAGLDIKQVKDEVLDLRPNPSRNSKTAKIAEKKVLGYVTVSTEYSAVEVPCTTAKGKRCLDVEFKVTCKSVKDIPSEVEADDVYCKVRFKELPDQGSTKDTTPVVKNKNPVWTKDNTFTYKWQAPAVETDDGLVPWSISHMSLIQQFQSNMRFLVEHQVLDGKSCDDPAVSKTSNQQKMCDAVAGDIPTDACDSVKEKLNDADQETCEGMVKDLHSGGALLQESDSWDDYDKDGNKKKAVTGATAFVGICIILMILLICLLR